MSTSTHCSFRKEPICVFADTELSGIVVINLPTILRQLADSSNMGGVFRFWMSLIFTELETR